MEPSFRFPFEPYEIQKKFMKELYLSIENKKAGIFESPTGTGKSLSICCGAIQWLKDNKKHIRDNLEKEILQLKHDVSHIGGTDWLNEEYEKIKKNQELYALKTKLDKIDKYNELLNEMKIRVTKRRSNKVADKSCEFKSIVDKKELDDKELAGTDVDSDLILEEIEQNDESDGEESLDEDQENNVTKIYLSSRTHSQLSQLVGEIKRTAFKDDTRVVTLASRQHYCINADVSKLKNVNLINERCIDMQQSKVKTTATGDDGKATKKSKSGSCNACPYYNKTNVTRLKEEILVDIMDLEDLVKCGKELKACPYYAARMALEDAEVVLISHAGIVSSGARSGMSLKLQDNILILDEAHGLRSALENAHSAPVTLKQLNSVKTFLQFYIHKYGTKLSPISMLSLNQMSFIIGKLIGIIKPQMTEKSATSIFTLEQFVTATQIDHLNLRPLVEFCRSKKLPPKLHGFSMRYNQQMLEEEINQKKSKANNSLKCFLNNISKKNGEQESGKSLEDIKPSIQLQNETSAGSGLYAILDFLEMLCDRSENGRVLVRTSEDGLLKYLLLNPAERFGDVVKQCRSVILAGGTMEPVSEFEELLTGKCVENDRVNIVKCEHVVPPENVLALCLSVGPCNTKLNFSYDNRGSDQLLNEVSRILRNICNIVPGGVVCFLPSYSFEDTVYEYLKGNKILEVISKKKHVFREPKSATEVDLVLHKYSAAVRNKSGNTNGALLLSVVGGKLSEGLNFSDDLGRCVIVVGMPYPNIKSAELQEKMKYMNQVSQGSGEVYYENLCLKAVNQCIGRAVRHANDYASILLVDERYSRPKTTSALPAFVQKSLTAHSTFGQAIGCLAKFFSKHKCKK